MSNVRARFPLIWGVVALCFILYLLLSFVSWGEPIMGDEVILALSVKGISTPAITSFFRQRGQLTFGIWHPPAYFHLLAFTWEHIAGPRALVARIPAAVCFLLCIFLVYLIAAALPGSDADKRRSAVWACVLFAINPLAVRGSLLVDIDGTVLNVLLLVFIYALVMTPRARMSAARAVLLSMLFAAALWAKLTTPAVLALSMVIAMALKKKPQYVGKAAAIIGGAIVLFLATWAVYSRRHEIDFFVIFNMPLAVVKGLFVKHTTSGGPAPLVRNLWALALWISPGFLALALWALRKCLGSRATQEEDKSFFTEKDLALYGLFVLVGYLFIGGVTHSFPKYHVVVVPVLCILISRLLVKESVLEKQKLFLFCGSIIILTVTFILLGDPLYTANYALKEQIILGHSAAPCIVKAVIQSAVIFILPFIAVCLPWPRALPSACRRNSNKRRAQTLSVLLACAMSYNVALSWIQQRAPYNTVYCYGAQGVKETGQFLRAHASPDEVVSAPVEILWISNNNLESYFAGTTLESPEAFIGKIREHAINVVAYGVTGNTLEQYKRIFNNSAVIAFLQKDYNRYTFGSYTVWLRRSNVE